MSEAPSFNLDCQPLDHILDELNLANSDLVAASTEQLTHKQVNKGRKGRRLTANVQQKIVKALNAVQSERKFSAEDLFTYGGHQGSTSPSIHRR